jgi:hypothetical protein
MVGFIDLKCPGALVLRRIRMGGIKLTRAAMLHFERLHLLPVHFTDE